MLEAFFTNTSQLTKMIIVSLHIAPFLVSSLGLRTSEDEVVMVTTQM